MDPADPKARLQVRVAARGLGERRVDVSATTSSSVTVTFDPANVLSVELSGAAGEPRAASLRVELREQVSRRSWTTAAPASIDADGRRVFAPRQPAPADLRLVLVSKPQGEWVLSSRRITTTAGPQRVVLTVPPLHAVTFLGAPPEQRLHVRWRLDDEEERAWLDVGPDGRAVADGLPEGDYEVERPGSEGTFVPFRVAGPTEVRLDR
jgi:hypothetical protein